MAKLTKHEGQTFDQLLKLVASEYGYREDAFVNSAGSVLVNPTTGTSVKEYGARGDGIANDTAAVNQAITAAGIGGTVFFPTGTYLISSKLTQLDKQKWLGDGSPSGTTLKKTGNCDLIEMGDLAQINCLSIDANGLNYTGKGILISHGFSQIINDLIIEGTASYGIDFAQDAGAGARVNNIVIAPVNPIPSAAVACIHITDDTTARPRFFSNIWLSGGAFDIGNCNDLFIDNAYVYAIKSSGTPVNVYINNCRMALIGDALTLTGTNMNYTNCTFAGPISFVNAQANRVVATEFGFGYTLDDATCQYNSIQDQLHEYTPVWSQPSGVQPVLGNGTLTGWWVREGYTVKVGMKFVAGNTTTFGNNGAVYQFSLPQMSHIGSNIVQLIPAGAKLYDASTATDYILSAQIAPAEKFVSFFIKEQALKSDWPVALGSGDVIYISFQYAAR